MAEIDIENPNQITMSKGRLRAQVHELEDEIVRLKGAPIRQEAERLRAQVDRLLKRCVAIESQALVVVDVALALARLVAVEPEEPVVAKKDDDRVRHRRIRED
jgi:hypothetical protein